MIGKRPVLGVLGRPMALGLALASLGATVAAPAQARAPLTPGNLLVSRSDYTPASIQPGVTQLPPGCTAGNCMTATNSGTYPEVFNNDLVDGSFGVTAKIFLDQLTPSGSRVSTLEVPNSTEPKASPNRDQLVTSFSSKSEVGLHLSTDGSDVTLMGYVAPVAALDVSNSNTPGVIDPTNPVPGAYYRAVATLDGSGKFVFTETNAYSGNNGRAAILNNAGHVLYTAGNAGNGGTPQPDGVILGAGAQIMAPSFGPEVDQSVGTPNPLGSFNITQLGDSPDKIGKDDNFRGLAVYNNVLYYTKGSGGNGVDTVYFVDTTGKACPNGSGLPVRGAPLPTSPLAYDPTTLQANGLPSNMCILQGFPTTLAKKATLFPFGIWFANRNTLYVTDEGTGDNTFSTATGQYTNAAAQTTAGLQKWVFDSSSGSWKLAYTLKNGLALGAPYTISGYPKGDNSATGLPWAPATDGLRNLAGHVNGNGTATIWAITSTVSGNGDQGADPNKLVAITDRIKAANAPSSESFATVRLARSGEVLRGVSFTPGTRATGSH